RHIALVAALEGELFRDAARRRNAPDVELEHRLDRVRVVDPPAIRRPDRKVIVIASDTLEELAGIAAPTVGNEERIASEREVHELCSIGRPRHVHRLIAQEGPRRSASEWPQNQSVVSTTPDL